MIAELEQSKSEEVILCRAPTIPSSGSQSTQSLSFALDFPTDHAVRRERFLSDRLLRMVFLSLVTRLLADPDFERLPKTDDRSRYVSLNLILLRFEGAHRI